MKRKQAEPASTRVQFQVPRVTNRLEVEPSENLSVHVDLHSEEVSSVRDYGQFKMWVHLIDNAPQLLDRMGIELPSVPAKYKLHPTL
jgi:hypothetical protein